MLTFIVVRETENFISLPVFENNLIISEKKKKSLFLKNNNNVHLELHNELKVTVIRKPLHLLAGSKPDKLSSCVLKAIRS